MCANVQTEPLISAWLYLFAFFLFNPHYVGLVILRLYKRMHKYSQLFIERLRAQLKQALWVRMQSDCQRQSHRWDVSKHQVVYKKQLCTTWIPRVPQLPWFPCRCLISVYSSFKPKQTFWCSRSFLTQQFLANYQFYWRIFSSWRGLKIPRARRKRLPSWKMWDLICFQCVSPLRFL